MNQKSQATISYKVDDLKYLISEIENEVFYLLGKELKKSPNDPDKIITWLKKNKTSIENQLIKFIDSKKKTLSNEIIKLLKNISLVSMQEADIALNIENKDPNDSKKEIELSVYKKEIDNVKDSLVKLIKKTKLSIKLILSGSNLNKIIINIKRGVPAHKL